MLIVKTELIDVAEERQLWGEQYQQPLSDIFALQGEIARDISAKLRLKLTGEERRRLTSDYRMNGEAYRLYLKGRYFWAKWPELKYFLFHDCLLQGHETFNVRIIRAGRLTVWRIAEKESQWVSGVRLAEGWRDRSLSHALVKRKYIFACRDVLAWRRCGVCRDLAAARGGI